MHIYIYICMYAYVYTLSQYFLLIVDCLCLKSCKIHGFDKIENNR